MKLIKARTTRFAEVVEKSGVPEPYTLWLKPAKDKHLQTLKKSSRLMTIQTTEAGTDFGVVGFVERPGARYLAFPKSLQRFTDHRIVGINWEKVKS